LSIAPRVCPTVWNGLNHMNPEIAVVALGSNLGDSPKILAEALTRLQGLSAAPLLKASLWRTDPVDCPPDSPSFLNTVAILVPLRNETAESLLDKLHALEKEFGRRPKTVHNEARPLDLDLILFGQKTRQTTQLILPHPRAHLRRFVLEPLNEIAPNLVFPGRKQTVAELLAALPVTEQVIRC
jgi:2-amino-4-hydroxy-6-hydroxymethyldihydropteridine diphosphokinase